MATLVLTTVGSLLGGPIGGAIGALAGQVADVEIFKPAGRQGPRVADLRVQTSSFGTQVPMLFGAMRVAGTVIWATDLQERSETSGGKGRASVTTYSYSASFAVALSSRPIGHVGRIWADGNLLRGAVGDFKTGIGAFRVHDGGADQVEDPLIAADRGAEAAPAHRGIAYAVFEGLDLTDFGNRIPSLTFEVFADEGPVAVSRIAEVLAGGEIVFAGDAPALGGYAAAGESAGEAVQPLLDGYALLLRGFGGLALTGGVPSDAVLRRVDDLGAARGERLAGRELVRGALDAVPRRLSVRHYDPERDYQAGAQSAERQGVGGVQAQVDLPATLDAAAARLRAADLLRRRMLGRRSLSVARGWRALALRPGDVVAVEGEGGGWRIEAVEWEGMAVRLDLVAVPVRPEVMPSAADGGSGVRQPDRPVGVTHLALIETPQLFDTPVDQPQLFVAACGVSGAWRGAAVLLREEDGGYAPLGSVRRGSVMGEALSVLGSGSPLLFDDAASVEVRLFDTDAVLVPAGDAALLNGANACMIGEELLQFGTASPSGPGRWRLGRLLRGRRGTEQHIAGHATGEGFVLLDAGALFAVTTAPRARVGHTVVVAAQGLGDATPVEAIRPIDGRALLPPSPVHMRLTGSADEGVTVSWIRRSRLGWDWIDGIDAPLGEERESYHMEIFAGSDLLRSEEVAAPIWTYSAGEIAADLLAAAGRAMRITVRQRGTYGVGQPARLPLPF